MLAKPTDTALEEQPAGLVSFVFKPKLMDGRFLNVGRRFCRRIGDEYSIEILQVDRSFVLHITQKLQQGAPVADTHEDDGEIFHLAGLDQSGDFE